MRKKERERHTRRERERERETERDTHTHTERERERGRKEKRTHRIVDSTRGAVALHSSNGLSLGAQDVVVGTNNAVGQLWLR
jgi:hypothetical protein